jgi:hypothetical protein
MVQNHKYTLTKILQILENLMPSSKLDYKSINMVFIKMIWAVYCLYLFRQYREVKVLNILI